MGKALVSFTLAGAEVHIPEETVRQQFLMSLAGEKASNTPLTLGNALTLPALGAYWEGQGGIFAGIVRGAAGWPDHYLIIPTHRAAEFHKVALGTYDQDVTGATSKSNGMANTTALAEAGSELCKEILELEIEGHRDWYLMSANEAHIAAANVPELFEKEGWYWTSTQDGRFSAFVQAFEGGFHYSDNKNSERRARAVRRIQLSD